MSFTNYLQKIRLLDCLIRCKATGTQKELARKMNMSVSTLNEYLAMMKENGFPIMYCPKRKCYYYEREGSMVDLLFCETMTKEEMEKKTGGYAPFFLFN